MLKTRSSKDEKYLLVVSIDNLDRCPHRQIVRVLEAVHLLLENNDVRFYYVKTEETSSICILGVFSSLMYAFNSTPL